MAQQHAERPYGNSGRLGNRGYENLNRFLNVLCTVNDSQLLNVKPV